MNYIIFDLEATCWKNREKQPNEIIEIGAVCVNDQKETVGEFVTFIQPTVHPQLSDFCTELTTITQEMVDDAPKFDAAITDFQKWIYGFGEDYILCSWGFYDRGQLRHDCDLHQLDDRWIRRHISLKHQYAKGKRTRPMGMGRTLKKEKLELEGTHHRGIDDAKNIAKIFIKCFDLWDFSKAK